MYFSEIVAATQDVPVQPAVVTPLPEPLVILSGPVDLGWCGPATIVEPRPLVGMMPVARDRSWGD